MGLFEDKTVLVSGSGRGIGRAVALRFAVEGANVVVNDLDADVAGETAAEVERLGGKAAVVAGSVTDKEFADRFVNTALDRFQGIDVVVNNAGYTWDNVIQKMGDDQWEAMLDVHLTAPFRILRAAGEYFRATAKEEQAAGREVFRKVVNVSSVSGVFGKAGQTNYAAAKMGVVGFTKSLAKEWGRYKVNVNSVAFGLVTTRLTRATDDPDASIDVAGRNIRVGIRPERLDEISKAIPLGRPAEPEEGAGAIYMLCTPDANYVTGQLLVVDGGQR
ncbi:SDR family NAD(P)-dependent oxidoreductase [Mycobacterium sp. E1747]|uniref:SDR family NAD(P)-dependent oxidoreductase n=1 Tax=Mycobacterium sp. E1747 TaxID=1834128 RepID=UPI0007FBCF8F|nr:SDR family oxidoreductase [Mycobacterium sp. E1747]OBH05914.1 3-oxoacyl-ACP reductase [Mycobacterium sp. E1747]